MKVGDLVRIKTGYKIGESYWGVLLPESYEDVEGFTANIIKKIGKDKFILDIDPSLVLTESILELVKAGNIPVEWEEQPVEQKQETKHPSQDVSSSLEKREEVIKDLIAYQEIINPLLKDNPKMYFDLLHDKLSSILYEKYGC